MKQPIYLAWAKLLFDKGKISEDHYRRLVEKILNMEQEVK